MNLATRGDARRYFGVVTPGRMGGDATVAGGNRPEFVTDSWLRMRFYRFGLHWTRLGRTPYCRLRLRELTRVRLPFASTFANPLRERPANVGSPSGGTTGTFITL